MNDEENNGHDANEPDGVNTILISSHKIICQIHGLHIEESQYIDAGCLEVSKVSKFITPNLPYDETQKAQH